MSAPICNSCNREAVIDYLPGGDEDGAELWCFAHFVDNYCTIVGEINVRPRKRRDPEGPNGQLSGEVILDVYAGVPE